MTITTETRYAVCFEGAPVMAYQTLTAARLSRDRLSRVGKVEGLTIAKLTTSTKSVQYDFNQ